MAPHYNDGVSRFDSGLHYDVADPPPLTMATKKVTYPVTEIMGFCDAVVAMLNEHKTAMIAEDVDPTDLITAIGTEKTSLNTVNTQQEAAKTVLRTKTIAVDAAKITAYNKASKGCDQLIAAFGRTSEEAKEAINLRKGLKHESRPPDSPTPPGP